jgi:hypothetical protein
MREDDAAVEKQGARERGSEKCDGAACYAPNVP